MDAAWWPLATLELRQQGDDGSAEVAFNFPYGDGNMAVISDRGTVRKESFTARAFAFAVNDESRAIAVLRGHDPNAVLGMRTAETAGQVRFEDTVESLRGFLSLPRLVEQTFHQEQFLRELRQGLVRGISPGFRVPPAGTVPNAVKLVPEPGNPAVMIRQINQAVLHEVSFVSRPAYSQTTVDTRAEGLVSQRPRAATLWL